MADPIRMFMAHPLPAMGLFELGLTIEALREARENMDEDDARTISKVIESFQRVYKDGMKMETRDSNKGENE